MKAVVVTLVGISLLGISSAAAFVYSGTYNVAATDHHWSSTYWLLEKARIRSIRSHAAGIAVPTGYDAPDKVLSAVDHFAEHCTVCHGGPGVDRGDFATGMYPQPPDLTNVSKHYNQAELFWILKHGIKMSGMPSMADDGDNMLWATVGFLEKLPDMSPDDYNNLRMAAQAQGGGHHGMMNMDGMNMPGMGHDQSTQDSDPTSQEAPPKARAASPETPDGDKKGDR